MYGHGEVGRPLRDLAGELGISMERVRQIYWLRLAREQRRR
jgi:DNA-directed RNA polymerase sigma subunit (sigma70/sigma32)